MLPGAPHFTLTAEIRDGTAQTNTDEMTVNVSATAICNYPKIQIFKLAQQVPIN
jgi:hypothetical protein